MLLARGGITWAALTTASVARHYCGYRESNFAIQHSAAIAIVPSHAYSQKMTSDPSLQELKALAERIERLLEFNRRLEFEHRSLQQSYAALDVERAALLAKNDQARHRIEAMISRLKALEQSA